MRIAVCPGSFDPVTRGHIDIFQRASVMFDQLIVAVFHNPNKKAMFSMEERVNLLRQATGHIENVRVDSFSGLLHQYVRQNNSNIIIRGLRALSDFEYEFQRALFIKKLDSQIETLFIMTNSEYSFLSSTAIKELAQFGGDLSAFAPPCVEQLLIERIQRNQEDSECMSRLSK